MWWRSLRAASASALALALLCAIGTVSCGRDDTEALAATIARYIGAVQEQDVPQLWALRPWPHGTKVGIVPDPAFEAEANGYFADYEVGKRAGELRFDSWGIACVKSLALGKGAYYNITSVERPSGAARFVNVHVPLPYEHLNYEGFPEGTVLYFLAEPLGKIFKHEVKNAETVRRKLLSEITLRWTLVPDAASPALSSTGWTVLAVSAVDGSARFREMEVRIGRGVPMEQ